MGRVLLFLLLLFVGVSPAQQLYFFKPDNLKQLPSSETYNVMQDSKGYIWFSTEAGLCKYNGDNITVFDGAKGLPEGATYCVTEDKKGELWIITSKNRILNYSPEKDMLIESPVSKLYKINQNKNLHQIYSAKFEGDSNLWLTAQHTTHKVNVYTNKIELLTQNDSADYFFVKKTSSLLEIKINMGRDHSKETIKNKMISLLVQAAEEKKFIPIPFTKNYGAVWRSHAIVSKKGVSFISFDNTLVKLYPDLSYEIHRFENVILGVHLDADDDLWVYCFKGGTILFPEGNLANAGIKSLQGLSVTGVCIDKENGVWCTTIEKGVFYCRNKQVINYMNIPGMDKKADLLKAIGNRLFVSSQNGELIEFYGSNVKRIKLTDPSGLSITDILPYNGAWVITGKGFVLKADSLFRSPFRTINHRGNFTLGANQICLNKDVITGISFGELHETNTYKSMVRIDPLKSAGKCLLLTSKKKFLLGCKDGIYEVNETDYSHDRVFATKTQVSKMTETSDGTVWIATKGDGLFTLKDGKFENKGKQLALPSNRLYDLCVDTYQTLWLASGAGIIKIESPYKPGNVSCYNVNNGIMSNEISGITATQDQLFVSTYDGISSFPLQYDLKNNSQPAIYIHTLKINGTTIDRSNTNPVFPYDQNNLKITFDALTYKKDGAGSIYSRVLGLTTKLESSKIPVLELDNLKPGNYTLLVFALNNDNRVGKPLIWSFTIQRPFWQKPIFIIGLLLILIGAFGLIINITIGRIRKKEQQKTEINTRIAQYQMSALRSQMNPHFIFNCINSIQRYVLTNQPDEAYNYLSKFGKLIRLVLNYADENFITLREELEVVELYLQLEQMRVDDRFSYEIKADKGVNYEEIDVPVMMLQPYVENSIWHGIMNMEKGKKGHISIHLSVPEYKVLQIVAEDNGIGREKAAALAEKNHASKSAGINKKRVDIMNYLGKSDKTRVDMEDVLDKNNNVAGTRVTIKILQINNHE